MGGSLIIKRDPVVIGAVLIALVGVLSAWLDWSQGLTGGLIALIGAATAAVQQLNVFGTDKFTALALNLVGAVFALLIGLNVTLPDSLGKAILAGVPIFLSLFARNGVTNRFAPDGSLTQVPTGWALDETSVEPGVGPVAPTADQVYGNKYEAALGHGALDQPE